MVLPKNVLKKYLFQLRVPLSYTQCTATLRACQNDTPLPQGITGKDVMLLKKVLQTYRNKQSGIDKQVMQLERDMTERAAELGHNDAIALLAGEVLQTTDQTQDDTNDADRLLTQLMDQSHPLAFKISGDVAYKSGKIDEARRFYQLAVDNHVEETVKVECLRNIGLISFTQRNLSMARAAFQSAIDESEDGAKVMDCHFYLGQILDSNKRAAKYHFEKAAMHGLKESFAPLGFLNLNYFNKHGMAEEWFKLGKEVGDVNCVVGLLDLYSKSDMPQAVKTLEVLRKSGEFDKIKDLRKDSIEKVEGFMKSNDMQFQGTDRWGI